MAGLEAVQHVEEFKANLGRLARDQRRRLFKTVPKASAEDFAAQAQALILGQGPSLDEIGATKEYLWDSPSVTGQMIAIDGGQHLAWQTPDVAEVVE